MGTRGRGKERERVRLGTVRREERDRTRSTWGDVRREERDWKQSHWELEETGKGQEHGSINTSMGRKQSHWDVGGEELREG